MKKFLLIIVIILFSFPIISNATTYMRSCTVGGTTGCLDAIDGALLAEGDRATIINSYGVFDFWLDADSATAESVPYIISPDTNPGDKRWILINNNAIVFNYTALRALNVTNYVSGDRVYVMARSTLNDGGGGVFIYNSGAAPGTYSDEDGCVILSTGGDGSAAWIRDHKGIIDPIWYGAIIDDDIDDGDDFNDAITYANSIGGAIVTPSKPGTYTINTSIIPLSNVKILGLGPTTILEQTSDNAIETLTGNYVYQFELGNFKFIYNNDTPLQTDCALLLYSHNYSYIHDLIFEDYDTTTAVGSGVNDGQIIVKITPNYAGSPSQNTIFNTYARWEVKNCRIGIWYEGLDGGSTVGPLPTTAGVDYIPISVISQNSWYNICLRKVNYIGIYAKQWADSESWYDLYAQAAEDNVILVNLNTDLTNWWQIDRFHFISPTIVYDGTTVTDPSTITGFRLGPGTNRTIISMNTTDKVWDSTGADPTGTMYFIDDDDSAGYEISGGSWGQGYNYQTGRLFKNSCTEGSGTATIVTGNSYIDITHGMKRLPTLGEVVITPGDDWTGYVWWISFTGPAVFRIHIDSNAASDLDFGWSIKLKEL